MPLRPNQHLYSRRWERRRKHQLSVEPLCKFCLARGIVTPATVCDHVTPHHGDRNAFFLGELQSLCKPCHDHVKQQQERHGYCRDIGLDGWPLDPMHPVYRT